MNSNILLTMAKLNIYYQVPYSVLLENGTLMETQMDYKPKYETSLLISLYEIPMQEIMVVIFTTANLTLHDEHNYYAIFPVRNGECKRYYDQELSVAHPSFPSPHSMRIKGGWGELMNREKKKRDQWVEGGLGRKKEHLQ